MGLRLDVSARAINTWRMSEESRNAEWGKGALGRPHLHWPGKTIGKLCKYTAYIAWWPSKVQHGTASQCKLVQTGNLMLSKDCMTRHHSPDPQKVLSWVGVRHVNTFKGPELTSNPFLPVVRLHLPSPGTKSSSGRTPVSSFITAVGFYHCLASVHTSQPRLDRTAQGQKAQEII